MTFVFASKYREDVVFFADSAITSKKAFFSNETHSMFGQLQHRDEFVVEERSIKIVHLPPFVLGYAGDVSGAQDFTNFLDRNRFDARPSEVFESAVKNTSDARKENKFWIIVGFVEEETARLWFVDHSGAIHRDIERGFGIGSGGPHLTNYLTGCLVSAKQSDEDSLQAVERLSAHFQWHAAHGDLMGALYSGGACIGAVLRSDGRFEWQRDAIYYLYSTADIETNSLSAETTRSPWIIAVTGRGAGMVVSNLSHGQHGYSKHLSWSLPSESALETCRDAVARAGEFLADSYIFVSVDQPTVTIVRCRWPGATCHAFHFQCGLPGGRMYLHPTSQLRTCLLSIRRGRWCAVDHGGRHIEITGPYTYVIFDQDEGVTGDEWLAWHDRIRKVYRPEDVSRSLNAQR